MKGSVIDTACLDKYALSDSPLGSNLDLKNGNVTLLGTHKSYGGYGVKASQGARCSMEDAFAIHRLR